MVCVGYDLCRVFVCDGDVLWELLGYELKMGLGCVWCLIWFVGGLFCAICRWWLGM